MFKGKLEVCSSPGEPSEKGKSCLERESRDGSEANAQKIGASSICAFEKEAYYSEFVTCGLAYGCPSHAPISVPIKEGQSVSGIDPIDWYKN